MFDFFSASFLGIDYINLIFRGLLVTFWISFFTIIISTVLGFFLALIRESKLFFFRYVINIYISLFRNTPLLIQIFFWYFAAINMLPKFMIEWLNTPHQISIIGVQLVWPSFEFLAGMIGLILYSTPFIAEELKSGIYAVKIEQTFAALALGFSNFQVMRYVIFPQAFKIAIPLFFNQYMNIIKNSSLTMAIGVAELSYVSRQIENESLQTFAVFGITTILYLIIIFMVELCSQLCQKHFLIKKYSYEF
ncbi:amino acid ABC transporter permease [Arsenophonus symbiont of Ornithomya chloropus]|uniref:amino acid ABC transporter permease n=1 Tax=Arsenophonus symbiont of Ornithomya chloropus TaxID=634121 RepID=UPI0032B1E9A4